MNKTINMKKIIAAALIIVSFLLTFSPWVKLTIDSRDYSEKEFVQDLEDEMDSLISSLEYYVDDINTSNVRYLVRAVKDLKLTPSEAFNISRMAVKPTKEVADALEDSAQAKYYTDEIETFRKIHVGMLAYIVLYLLNIAAAVFVLYSIITGKFTRYQWAYFLTRAVLFGLCVFAVIKGNGELSNAGVDDEGSFALTLASFISIIFALPQQVYMSYLDRVDMTKATEAAANITDTVVSKVRSIDTSAIKESISNLGSNLGISSGWTCPACGTKNGNDSKFCSGCGIANPFITKCENCGKEYKNNEKFCTECGTKLIWPVIEKKVEKKPKEVTAVCEKCGRVYKDHEKFCEDCGIKLIWPGTEEKTIEEQPEEPTAVCEKCGRVYKNHEEFCEECGTKLIWPGTEEKIIEEQPKELTAVCEKCGRVYKNHESFCEECGTPLKWDN